WKKAVMAVISCDWTSLAIRARSCPRSSSITTATDAELVAGARPDGDAELGRLGHGLALPADFELQLPLVLLLRDLDLELHLRPRCQPERALARFEADLAPLETDRERGQILRDLLRRGDAGELELVLPHAGLLRTTRRRRPHRRGRASTRWRSRSWLSPFSRSPRFPWTSRRPERPRCALPRAITTAPARGCRPRSDSAPPPPLPAMRRPRTRIPYAPSPSLPAAIRISGRLGQRSFTAT